MLEFFDNFRVVRMNFYEFSRSWQQVAARSTGPSLRHNTDIRQKIPLQNSFSASVASPPVIPFSFFVFRFAIRDDLSDQGFELTSELHSFRELVLPVFEKVRFLLGIAALHDRRCSIGHSTV